MPSSRSLATASHEATSLYGKSIWRGHTTGKRAPYAGPECQLVQSQYRAPRLTCGYADSRPRVKTYPRRSSHSLRPATDAHPANDTRQCGHQWTPGSVHPRPPYLCSSEPILCWGGATRLRENRCGMVGGVNGDALARRPAAANPLRWGPPHRPDRPRTGDLGRVIDP